MDNCSEYSADGDYEEIWSQHCKDEVSLGEYACAMQHLAQEHWSTKHPDDRIKWSHQTCMKYFFDGGLAQALQKDRRKKDFHQSKVKKTNSKSEELCNISKNILHGNGISAKTASEDALERISTSYNTISLPFSGQLRLLDVGSCFNPFLDYEEFLSIGIDISPAVTSVYKCDFLNLQLQQPLQVYSDTVNRYLQMLKNPVTILPRECFHVVVFSLLLSYFPSPYQRWLCCQKAHQLLQLHGLLIIITPKAGNQRNSTEMMKSWKTAIESMGFSRWRFHSDDHLQFMAFRKVSLDSTTGVTQGEVMSDMLYIPQDYNEECEESVYWESEPRLQVDHQEIRDVFKEFPFQEGSSESIDWNGM